MARIKNRDDNDDDDDDDVSAATAAAADRSIDPASRDWREGAADFLQSDCSAQMRYAAWQARVEDEEAAKAAEAAEAAATGGDAGLEANNKHASACCPLCLRERLLPLGGKGGGEKKRKSEIET